MTVTNRDNSFAKRRLKPYRIIHLSALFYVKQVVFSAKSIIFDKN